MDPMKLRLLLLLFPAFFARAQDDVSEVPP